MDPIAANIRRGLFWVGVPLALASFVRLILEPIYLDRAFLQWLALLAGYLALQTWLLRRAPPRQIRAAMLVNFLAISGAYQAIGVALRSAPGWRADSLVYRIDQALFHGDPQRFLIPLHSAWLSTVTMLGYLGFFIYLIYLFLSEAFVLSPATGRLQLGLMRLYGLGFSGYLLLPAEGPAFHHPALLPPLIHSAFSARIQPWILAQCSRVDVCPSIHAAVATFLLVWLRHRRPWLFWVFLLPSAALLLGTVYLQYHYFLDLPFGILLGAGAAFSVLHDLPTALHRPAGAGSQP